MRERGSLDDFYAFKSTSGGADSGGSSSGGSGCSTWFYVAIFVLFALNELCKLFQQRKGYGGIIMWTLICLIIFPFAVLGELLKMTKQEDRI